MEKGYTIPELIIVAVVLGVFSIVTINKASYAFEDTNAVNEKTEALILEKSANMYGNKIKEDLKSEKTKFILASDLIEAGYLVEDDSYKNVKIKLTYNEENDSISAEIMD